MSRLFDALTRAAETRQTVATGADNLAAFAAEADAETDYDPNSSEPAWDISETTSGHEVACTAAEPPPVKQRTASRAATERQEPVSKPTPAMKPVARGGSDEVTIADLIRVVLLRWKWIPAALACTLSIAYVYNATATRLYEARARLLLDVDSTQVVPFRVDNRDTGRMDYYVTQLEVLRSPALMRKALEKIGALNKDGKLQAGQAAGALGSLTVAPVRTDMGDSRVINVIYRSTDPQFAAKMANGIADAYVTQNLEMRRQGSIDASTWLNERLGELRKEVTARDSALQQYREQKGSVSLDDRANIVVQKLAQLNAAVTTAHTDTAYREAQYKQLTTIQEKGDPVDTFPPIIANTLIQGLKAELASLQRERAQASERLGELHPDMIKINTAIEGAERRLNAEMSKIIEGVKNDYKAAQARETGLVQALEDQKREVLNLNQKSIEYSALQRDATTTQQIFDAVLQRVKETDLAAQLQSNNVRVLDAAEVPRSPVRPQTRLNLLIALIGGGFLAIVLVIGLEYFNPSISDAGHLQETFGLPVLGTTPRVAALKEGPLTLDRLPPEFHEALRGVRTRILLSPVSAGAQALAVTSAMSGEGKTVMASCLATSMALAGKRVLLVDADMRRPQVHRTYDILRAPGLSNVLAGQLKAPDAVRETAVPGLSVFPAGDDLPNVGELLDSAALTALTEGFANLFDLIVLDCPPVMAVADATIVANATSAVLFVIGSGTARDVAAAAVDRLVSVHAQIVGVVLNKARHDRRFAYDSYLYHQPA